MPKLIIHHIYRHHSINSTGYAWTATVGTTEEQRVSEGGRTPKQAVRKARRKWWLDRIRNARDTRQLKHLNVKALGRS